MYYLLVLSVALSVPCAASVSILSGTLAENHASLRSQYVGEEKSMLIPAL